MRGLLWLVAGAWLLFALGLWLLHGWIVPRIDEFRPRLEAEASQALGVPVRIGGIAARSRFMIPTFELRNVSLLDKEGREAVRLSRLLGALSLSSLWRLGFEQLVIDGPELDIRRGADGRIFVGGIDVSKDMGSGHSRVVDWLFSQTEVVVRNGTLRWTDALRKAPPLELGQVNVVLRSGLRRHAMRLDASPPPGWGDRFSLRGIFRQPLLSASAGDVSKWSGQLYADFRRIDVSRLRPYVGFESPGVAIDGGHGALRAWADVRRGKFSGVLADVALRDVQARLGETLEALEFESLSGRFAGARRADGFEASTERLEFLTPGGLRWPGGNLVMVHAGDQPGARQHGTLKADRLDLAALSRIASRLPLDSATQARIASFAPRGLVESLDARWQGSFDAPVAFAAKGRVTNLGIASLPEAAGAAPQPGPAGRAEVAPARPNTPGRPGISGATVDFDVTHEGGQARIKVARGALELPGIFEETRVPLDDLSAEAQWKLAGRKIDVQLRNLQFANADAQGQAQVRWHTDDAPRPAGAGAGAEADHRFPGVLDLQGALSRGDGSRVHRYLPLVLGNDVRHYVRDAVVKGQVSDVKFKVKGNLRQLPFKNPAAGDFQISAKARNVQFTYVPKSIQPADAAPWPALTDLSGELVFSRVSMDIKNASGRVAGLPGLQLVKGEARIADLTQEATVDVGLDVRGPLSDALGFVNSSPVGAMTGQALAKTVASGGADYRFRLKLPIHAIENSTVEGSVALPGNDVSFAPEAPQLAALKGVVSVSERGFEVTGAQARVLGGDIRIDGGTRPGVPPDGKPGVAFRAQGTLTAEGLRQAKDLGFAARLATHASGGAAYSASVLFRRGLPEVTVTSSLQGMALNLPPPLAKTADTALPLRFENALLPASLGPGQTLQDQLSVSLGRVASVCFVRDVSGAEPRVIRGGIGVGLEGDESAPAPLAGVAANVKLAQLDLDAWEKILDEPSQPRQPARTAGPAGARATSPPDAIAGGYLPTQFAIRAGLLKVQGRSLNRVVVGGSRDGPAWRANIDAAELNGYFEFRQPGGPQGAGRVYARLSRLNLAASQASEVEAMLDEQPASIPALDIVVEDMELRGKKLGRVEIDAVNRVATAADGGMREWQLNKFNVIVPEATLNAAGTWAAAAPGERRRAVMNFKLDVADSGELLGRLGMAGVVRRGRGRLEGRVAWAGSPLSLDYPSLSGKFNVNVESGQFLKADPGIAKLLGVLSLQSLPRRLTLDFRDVFSQGFAFDFVRGDVAIDNGVARTDNLRLGGVNAAVLMEGSADIAHETQSLKVVVVPELDAGTASLIATVINPAFGLGSFLAQMFLRRPLTEAATQEFQIDGAWSDPKITKIDRRARARAQTGETPVQIR